MAEKKTINSNYLKWFNQIEKSLWSLFDVFGDLCSRCAVQTLSDLSEGRRSDRDQWCCCMIDNQVHDTWDSLNAVQSRFDRKWYESIRRPKDVRKVGNGPCPALGDRGCQIKKCRPITCTTQLCSKMLVVLNDLGIVKVSTKSALQIEDLISLPDILPDLYGTRNSRKVDVSEVKAYISGVKSMKEKIAKGMSRKV